MEKAISLYFKAGYIARAVELCFKTKNFLKLGDFGKILYWKRSSSFLLN